MVGISHTCTLGDDHRAWSASWLSVYLALSTVQLWPLAQRLSVRLLQPYSYASRSLASLAAVFGVCSHALVSDFVAVIQSYCVFLGHFYQRMPVSYTSDSDSAPAQLHPPSASASYTMNTPKPRPARPQSWYIVPRGTVYQSSLQRTRFYAQPGA